MSNGWTQTGALNESIALSRRPLLAAPSQLGFVRFAGDVLAKRSKSRFRAADVGLETIGCSPEASLIGAVPGDLARFEPAGAVTPAFRKQ